MGNKIYNNLNIENLIKTEWFNQFNFFQKLEINKGIEANIDASIYANPEYSDEQMAQIRKLGRFPTKERIGDKISTKARIGEKIASKLRLQDKITTKERLGQENNL